MSAAMTRPIRRVAVLGAGVMGSGIAAHCANAGQQVLLFDIRTELATGALDKLKKAKPAAFFHARNQLLISVGNFDADLAKVADCDLIVEAIIEKLDIKRSLFEKLDKLTEGKDTIIASNTSGLRIAEMIEGRSKGFRERFLVTRRAT
jgi:3-hydroxyacyl-CoA dehydrogenase